MRKYLWIFVSLVLPAVFLYVMKMRPPSSPGVIDEARLSPEQSAAARVSAVGTSSGTVDGGAGSHAELSR